MIPAILSVVFVVYLYQSLNGAPDAPVGTTGEALGSGDQSDLAARLSSLQSRIERLAEQGNQKGGKR